MLRVRMLQLYVKCIFPVWKYVHLWRKIICVQSAYRNCNKSQTLQIKNAQKIIMNLLTIFCYYNQKKTRVFHFFTCHKPPNKPVTFVSMRTEWMKKQKQTQNFCSDEYFQNLIRILGFSTARQLEIDSEWKEVSTAAFEITKI